MGTDSNPDLSHLSTEWSLVFLAHGGTPEQAASAQVELMGRYSGAVHRYLRDELGDPDAALDLDQEFAVRFLRGDFHRADPALGRFRDFVKRALRNLMIDHHRRASNRPKLMGDDLPEGADPMTADLEFDRRFAESWRAELLARAWAALSRLEEQTGRPYHTVLKLRVDHPSEPSDRLAARLSEALGRTVSEGALRMLLHRARGRLVDFLLEEVAGSLPSPTADDLEQELIDLGLQVYCRNHRKRPGLADDGAP